ncbi:MAG: 6-bladed beta-propeller [Prevotellaceae bacterium]|jgi:hypothetical protein|nr:6-bladed beta-propeller [Prevotellaceae bacterium]
MKKSSSYFFVLLCLLFIECKQKHIDKEVDIPVKLHPVDPGIAEKVYASKIFDSIVYIPLETTAQAIVGEITKVEIIDSLIYCLDRQTHAIWCFNQKGKYVNHIHKRGQGPGEYVSIFDFTVDRLNNLIAILDRNTKKILWYTLSGKFVKSTKLEVSPSNFGLLNDNKILAYTRGVDIFMKGNDGTLGYNYFIIDSTGKTDAYFPYNDVTDNLVGNKIMEVNDNKVLATYAANDIIYEFDMDGNLTLKHVIDFGKYRIPLEKTKDEKYTRELFSNPQYAQRASVYYSDNYFLVTYSFEGRVRFWLCNNKNDKNIVGSFLENDIDFISLADPTPLTVRDNKIYYLKDAYFILKQKHDGKPAYLNIPTLSSLKEDDNAVLMIGYLKF